LLQIIFLGGPMRHIDSSFEPAAQKIRHGGSLDSKSCASPTLFFEFFSSLPNHPHNRPQTCHSMVFTAKAAAVAIRRAAWLSEASDENHS
jgi:hypothetical protein